MKKFAVFALACIFALSACLPTSIISTTSSSPTVDVDAIQTMDFSNTSIAQTRAVQPSPTTAPATNALFATAGDTSTSVPNTETPSPNLTTTPATATNKPIDVTATPSPIKSSGLPTASPTNGILTYGTLPPANTPYTKITIVNKAHREVYISLQVVTDSGVTIIEYPVKGFAEFRIPVGNYTYVAWVGGRQFIGNFKVSKGDEPIITIYKDKIIIN